MKESGEIPAPAASFSDLPAGLGKATA